MKMILGTKTYKWLLVLVPSLALLILAVASIRLLTRKPSELSPASLFGRIVVSPIPESVKDIRASCPLDKRIQGRTEHTYVLRFGISKEDLSRVVASRKFVKQKVVYTALDEGLYLFNIGFDPNVTWPGVKLYATNHEVPDWFDLPQWKRFEAYYAGTEVPANMFIKVHLLLYNEQLSRAYFVDHEAIGEGPRPSFPFHR